MHVSIKAEDLQNFINLPITNSILATFLLLAFFGLILLKFKSIRLTEIPGRLQNLFEFIIDSLDGLTSSIAAEKSRVFLPFIGSFFIFILLSNWMGLLPGFGSIGFNEELHGKKILVPLLRGPTADLNTTIALAILSVILIQAMGVKFLKTNYFKKFINLKGPIEFFLGVLELISEFAKILSFAFRLFGNIFAGEVLLTVIAFLTYGVAILPFFGLEIFVGFVQALVFSMLTLVFMHIATLHHE